MSAVPPTITEIETLYGHAHSVVWVLTGGDTGTPYAMPVSADRSVHAFGTWDTATLTMQGSNEVAQPAAGASSWVSLHDPQGVAFTMTANKIEEVAEVSAWIRPSISAGGGSTAVTVAMIVKRAL